MKAFDSSIMTKYYMKNQKQPAPNLDSMDLAQISKNP